MAELQSTDVFFSACRDKICVLLVDMLFPQLSCNFLLAMLAWPIGVCDLPDQVCKDTYAFPDLLRQAFELIKPGVCEFEAHVECTVRRAEYERG